MVRKMSSEIGEIEKILHAKPDLEFTKRESTVKFAGSRERIYVASDDLIYEEGFYVHIKSENTDIYLPKELIMKMMNMIRGDEIDDGSI